jgi:hypothetical protein
MFKKSIAFGLLAATLMVAPGAAFADQNQSNDQYTEQNGAALDGSINSQNSVSTNRQSQNKNSSEYRGRYGRYYSCGNDGDQNQDSRQTTVQNGVAENGSINSQNSRTDSSQRQNNFNSRFCR